MKHYTLTILSFLFILFMAQISNGAKTENVKVKQLTSKISIVYDLTHEKIGQHFDVTAYYSLDGGTTFKGPIDSIKGDYGKGVKGGKNKVFVWDVLSEVPHLISEQVVFKVIAQPSGISYPKDQTSDFLFELKKCNQQENELTLTLNVTNTGKKKDLRIPNRLARIYSYDNTRYEAKKSILGPVSGNLRHSQPQATLEKGQTVEVQFSYMIPNKKLQRIKVFQLGFDMLEISYGLEVTPGKIEFRDFPVANGTVPKSYEAISEAKSIRIGEKIERPRDTEAPRIVISRPAFNNEEPPLITENFLLIKGQAEDQTGLFDVRVNNSSVDLSPEGTFETKVSLKEGFNEILLHATDFNENSIEKKYVVLHLPGDNQSPQKLREIAIKEAEMTRDLREGKFYAFLIGENDYQDPLITDLDNPIRDAEKLYNTLLDYYAFEKDQMYFLKNPTRSDIMIKLDKLNNQLNENDNLLIFYAGHGYWDSENEIGYWLPSDAQSDNTANWFRNSTLREYIHSLDTRHTMVIADACFSGSIFKTRKAFADAPQTIQNLYKLPSRKAMTSGNLKEVPDQSVFMKYFIKRLKENQKEYLTAEELFNSFKIAVMNNSPNEPQYGEIKNSGD